MKKNLKIYLRIIIIILVLFTLVVLIVIPPLIHAYKYNQLYNVGFSNVYKQVWKTPFKSLSFCFEEGNKDLYTTAVSIIGFAFLVLMAVIIVKRRLPKDYEGIEHGSGDWATTSEKYKVLSKNQGILLAKNLYLPLDKHGNVNVLVVGGSGSGKSASYVTPNATLLHGSYVYTDPKGELYNNTASFFRKNGYDVKVLNLVRPDNSDGFNPLFNVSSEADVDIIAHTIVKGQGGESKDPYWDDMAEILLKSLIYYLIAARPEEEQNLASAAELVRNAHVAGDINVLSDLIYELPSEHPARKNYSSVEIAPEKAFGSILSTLQSRLGKFDPQDIAALTSTNTINFDDIGQKKTVLYVISSDTHGTYDFILTIFFSQMIQRLYDFADENGGSLPLRTYFFLDEFANIGRIPDFDKKISTSRSRGISFSVILQSLDQLEAVYEKSHETIIGNCDTHLFLGSNSQKTLEYFSKALGEKTIVRDSYSRTEKVEGPKEASKTFSDNIYARALMTPDELRRLDKAECIIYESGVKPIKAQKFMWFADKKMRFLLGESQDNHNNYVVNRGEWRIFDPNKKESSTAVNERLAELFKEEETPESTKESDEKEGITETIKEETTGSNKISSFKNKDEFDLEKELEAKFDELFGKIEEEEKIAKEG